MHAKDCMSFYLREKEVLSVVYDNAIVRTEEGKTAFII